MGIIPISQIHSKLTPTCLHCRKPTSWFLLSDAPRVLSNSHLVRHRYLEAEPNSLLGTFHCLTSLSSSHNRAPASWQIFVTSTAELWSHKSFSLHSPHTRCHSGARKSVYTSAIAKAMFEHRTAKMHQYRHEMALQSPTFMHFVAAMSWSVFRKVGQAVVGYHPLG